MAKAKRRNSPAETNGDSGLVIEPESNTVVVRIPVRFYRRNGRQMILAKDDASGTNYVAAPAPNKARAANLAKAWIWQEQLESGEYATLEELARANRVDRTYVSRILQLTSIAPDLVTRILSGDESDGLSLRKLRVGIPFVWKEQRI
jgi:hypothetical protein